MLCYLVDITEIIMILVGLLLFSGEIKDYLLLLKHFDNNHNYSNRIYFNMMLVNKAFSIISKKLEKLQIKEN